MVSNAPILDLILRQAEDTFLISEPLPSGLSIRRSQQNIQWVETLLRFGKNKGIVDAYSRMDSQHHKKIVRLQRELRSLETGEVKHLSQPHQILAGVRHDGQDWKIDPSHLAALAHFMEISITSRRAEKQQLLEDQEALMQALFAHYGEENMQHPLIVPVLTPSAMRRNHGFDSQKVYHIIQEIIRREAMTPEVQQHISEDLVSWKGNWPQDPVFFQHYERFMDSVAMLLPEDHLLTTSASRASLRFLFMPAPLSTILQEIRKDDKRRQDLLPMEERTTIAPELLERAITRRFLDQVRSGHAHLVTGNPRPPRPPPAIAAVVAGPAGVAAAVRAPTEGDHVPGYGTLGPRSLAAVGTSTGLPPACTGGCGVLRPSWNHTPQNCLGPRINGVRPSLPPYPCVKCGLTTHRWHACTATAAVMNAFSATPLGQRIAV